MGKAMGGESKRSHRNTPNMNKTKKTAFGHIAPRRSYFTSNSRLMNSQNPEKPVVSRNSEKTILFTTAPLQFSRWSKRQQTRHHQPFYLTPRDGRIYYLRFFIQSKPSSLYHESVPCALYP